MTFTTKELQACVAREVVMRKTCYVKWDGKPLEELSPTRKKEIAMMEAIGERIANSDLTEREQKAIDNINAVLNGDGQDPDSGPGAWGDCGEVDVPVLLDLVARLTK